MQNKTIKSLFIITFILFVSIGGYFYFNNEQGETIIGKRPNISSQDVFKDTSRQLKEKGIEEGIENDVLYLGFMVHLEGWEEKDGSVKEIKFDKWVQKAQDLAEIFEKFDAKVTFEARPEFVNACEEYENNILNELYDRGHGIGVHADLGGLNQKRDGYTQEEFRNDMEEQRLRMEEVTGLDIRHVSGICSSLDWVSAAIDAGYEFTTGGVAMCGQSLDKENLPDGWTKEKTINDFHAIFPSDVVDRIYVYKTSDSGDWLKHDPKGKLVILSSDGVIEGFLEQHSESEEDSREFNQDDIDKFVEVLDEYLLHTRDDKVNQMYVALSIGDGIDMQVARAWLEAVEPYVEKGLVEWKTLPEVYDIYLKEDLLN